MPAARGKAALHDTGGAEQEQFPACLRSPQLRNTYSHLSYFNWPEAHTFLHRRPPPQSTLTQHILAARYSSLTMPVQDRTNEFRACVESIRSRSSLPARAEAKQRLLQGQAKDGSSKSEFTRMASAIAKDISSTSIKLGKLAQCMYCHIASITCTHVSQWPSEKHYSTTVLLRLALVKG